VGNRATNGRWAENVLVELEYAGASIPDHQRLTQELDYVRAGDYRALVRRIGSPLDHQKPADVLLVEHRAIRAQAIARVRGSTSCDLTSSATLSIGGRLTVRTGTRPATISARRFGSTSVPVRTVSPRAEVAVWTEGPSIIPTTPWHVSVAGGCIAP
jgi:hypothetical protein